MQSFVSLFTAEKVKQPTAKELWGVSMHQALPFIGFGFLDNLIMIVAGDYIDLTLGTALGITTLTAAALGNTISDVAGIGSAWYVESIALKGRALGVTLGCLLGMVPLCFLPTPEKEPEKKEVKKDMEKAILPT
ncbi:hypothetical protein J437_LFUL017184 [Ladona fulva]|uniref:Transmembrane protein 65 n=1 Tax=Ladona fulva TaxID=123851 RepID=A0A8K0P5U8_LADFU|nr:hypothetical protein J437_LFUL017184 [Ladona fulva]